MSSSFVEAMRSADPGCRLDDFTALEREWIMDDAVTDTSARRPLRWPRRLLAATAAVAVVAVGFQGYGEVTRAEAAQVLDQAAIAAIAEVDPPAKPGQYWEQVTAGTSIVGDPGGGLWLTTYRRVEYVAVDGQLPTWFVNEPRNLIRKIEGPADSPLLAGKRDVWTSNLSPSEMPAWWQNPTPAWLASLPRDPVALRLRVYADAAGHGNNSDDSAFTYVTDVLRSPLVPADLRAALFRVLGTLPGATITDSAVSVDGVHGVAIGRRSMLGGQQAIVVDPQTGQVVGEVQQHSRLPIFGPTLPATETATHRRLVDAVPVSVRKEAYHQVCKVINGEVEC
jgi:hypothetical protein